MKRVIEHLDGTVTNVWDETDGSELTVDATSGSTEFYLLDVSPFEVGKKMVLGDDVLLVSDVDADLNVVKTSAGITAPASVTDEVFPRPGGYTRYAMVTLDDNDEGIAAVVPPRFYSELQTGIRNPDDREAVSVADHHGNWRVREVHGQKQSTVLFESSEPTYEPSSSELSAGSFTRKLLHSNIAEGHGFFTTINGVSLGPDWWVLDAEAGTVTVTIPTWVGTSPSGRREFGWPVYAYWERGVQDPSFLGSSTASSNSTSITIPIPPVRRDGDLLLVSVARLLPSVPAGWTKVGEILYGIGGLTVLSKPSDGTETGVTLVSGSSGDQGGICLVYDGSVVVASDPDLSLNVPSPNNYKAPLVPGGTKVTFFLFDGVGSSGSGTEEAISTVSGTQRANRTISSGLFAVAAVEGRRPVVKDASPDAAVHDWASITVGLDAS